MTRSDLDFAVTKELDALGARPPAKELVGIANRYYKHCPRELSETMDLIDDYLAAGFPRYSLATSWAKLRRDLLDLANLPRIDEWLHRYVVGWWECDQLCYRVVNPLVYALPGIYDRVLSLRLSDNPYVRRAAPVSLIAVGPPNNVGYPQERVREVCDRLLDDPHVHVQRGVGWLLKCSYTVYPDEVVAYLGHNQSEMSRTTYRYAPGRMPKQIRAKLM